jgi:hypothetical protein
MPALRVNSGTIIVADCAIAELQKSKRASRSQAQNPK